MAAVEKYEYADEEWARRQDLLLQAGQTLKEYAQRYDRFVSVYLPPRLATLALHCELRPKIVSADEWDKIHKDISIKAPEIAKLINENPKNRLGNRLMLCKVPGEPVFSWQSPGSMRDMHTGRLPQGTKLRNIDVIFSFPYTIPLK